MDNVWSTPIYHLSAKTGKRIVVDVTSSVSAGLPPNKLLSETLIKFFKTRGVESIVDFGAGALRHTFPLLRAGFQVCAVEFENQFNRTKCAEALHRAQKHSNFFKLIWPKDFKKDGRRFDAALLCYVIQTMPLKEERELVLKTLRKKLREDSYLLWMGRHGQSADIPNEQAVKDGHFMWPDREAHSFYTEFTTEVTHEWMARHGFRRLRSLGERGTDQVFLYGKGSSTWV
jgi:hypothetical protein